jgi:hypothetical protein
MSGALCKVPNAKGLTKAATIASETAIFRERRLVLDAIDAIATPLVAGARGERDGTRGVGSRATQNSDIEVASKIQSFFANIIVRTSQAGEAGEYRASARRLASLASS